MVLDTTAWNAQAGPSRRYNPSQEVYPTVISIGTFLIDSFDAPPQPNIDNTPLPSHPAYSRSRQPHRKAGFDVSRVPSPSPSRVPFPKSSHSPTQIYRPHTPNGLPGQFLAADLVKRERKNSNGSIRSLLSSAMSKSSSVNDSPCGSGASTPQLDFSDRVSTDPSSVTTSPTSLGHSMGEYVYLGGGGLYALIGSRVFLRPDKLKILVDRAKGGSDMRQELEAQVCEFGKEIWCWNETEDTQMQKSRIRYDGDTRLFQNIVQPPYRTFSQIVNSPLFGARYLHIAPPNSSEDLARLQDEMARYAEVVKHGAGLTNGEAVSAIWKPKIVFEPTPPSCHSGQREWLEQVCSGLHVLSPNHEELLSFYGHSKISFQDPELIPTLERIMLHLIDSVGIGESGQGILLVRCGRLGGCVGTRKGGLRWFPAYYGGDAEGRVKDVTGAGNAFIGGYIAGLDLTNEDPYEAALYGTIAASFVVEQIGLPSIEHAEAGDWWNGDLPQRRLDELRARWTSQGVL